MSYLKMLGQIKTSRSAFSYLTRLSPLAIPHRSLHTSPPSFEQQSTKSPQHQPDSKWLRDHSKTSQSYPHLVAALALLKEFKLPHDERILPPEYLLDFMEKPYFPNLKALYLCAEQTACWEKYDNAHRMVTEVLTHLELWPNLVKILDCYRDSMVHDSACIANIIKNIQYAELIELMGSTYKIPLEKALQAASKGLDIIQAMKTFGRSPAEYLAITEYMLSHGVDAKSFTKSDFNLIILARASRSSHTLFPENKSTDATPIIRDDWMFAPSKVGPF